ncbi:hypothetical protein Misp01_62670 [Microtetraspora sp. NBRC 13810]|uniref:hypothetical protein n=1 Tax=Microtetraspora sp. NBRC 13810 TaxID=3030990 RepID=UPI0024A4E052|nr:hypothetical protein [Microtetraspora sp. NBRC 13810]GLW11139.1 hypothetical protein Misp01_62670 [Microtetraspora sp. NBRC 13810]
MSGPSGTPVSYLHLLADVLGGLSLDTRVEGQRLIVTNPHASRLGESITVAVDAGGVWHYRWSWGDPIAPVGNLHTVATRIKYVLTGTLR